MRAGRGPPWASKEQKPEEGQGNTLSRALILAPLFNNSFRTSGFPPRHAQWMAVDSSYLGKKKTQDKTV